jgi:thiol-disulfide isomerase/thioredoxin
MINFSISKAVTFFQFSFFFIVNSNLSVCAQPIKNNFELNGKIYGLNTGMIYLGYYINKEQRVINDSSLIIDGVFSFKGSISEPAVAFINLSRNGAIGANGTEIFIEPAVMNVSLQTSKFYEVHLTGSIAQKEYEDLRAIKMSIKEKYKQQWNQWTDENFSGNRDSLGTVLTPLFDSLKKTDFTFFLSHPTSYVTAYFLQQHMSDLPIDSLTFIYTRLGNKLQQNIIGKRIFERISQQKSGSPGSMAKYFFAKDVNGNPVLSKLFKGRYLLLDFWASWCVPCRKNNPHLISVYKKYKGKGLAVIGIADDDGDTAAWKRAIETDSVGIWNHVLRGLNKIAKLKGERNDEDISEKFGVEVIPTMILIDKNGMIIGRYKGADDNPVLDKKLSEIFN